MTNSRLDFIPIAATKPESDPTRSESFYSGASRLAAGGVESPQP